MTPASSSTSINPSYPLYSIHRPLDPIDSLLIRVDARVIEEIPVRSDHSLTDLALEIGFVEDGLDIIECDADLGSHQTVNCVIPIESRMTGGQLLPTARHPSRLVFPVSSGERAPLAAS
jgi:hypothetical protein